jgi:hypothetical protein
MLESAKWQIIVVVSSSGKGMGDHPASPIVFSPAYGQLLIIWYFFG